MDDNNKDIETIIGQGNIKCKGALGITEITQGQINATGGKFSGTISGSGITASTFSGEHNLFRVLEDGSVETADLTATGTISATTLAGDELNVPLYAPALTEDITVYIKEGVTSPSEITDEKPYASLDEFLKLCPSNLNGHIVDIYLQSNITDNMSINGCNNGRIRLHMQKYTIKGYLYVRGVGLHFNLYGNKQGSTGGADNRGKIIPNVGYPNTEAKVRYFNLFIYATRARIHDVDFYKGNGQDDNYGICISGGCSAVAKNIRAINKPQSLIRVIENSSAYIEGSAGYTTYTSIQAIDGSTIHLAEGTHAGGSSSHVYMNNGSIVYPLPTTSTGAVNMDSGTRSGITFDTTVLTDSSSSSTNTSTGTTTTKTVTIKSNTGLSYRTDGSGISPWSTDKVVRQGRWSTSLGKNTGYWFFGSEIYNILKNNSASNITSIKIKITRQSGGSSAAVTHYLRAHTYASKPGTPSLIGTGTLNKSFSLAVGGSTTISLTASEISALKSAGAKGFGIYTSNMTTGASGHYSCCSPSCTVTITYKS